MPDVVVVVARGASITPVWQNERGGVTFRLDDGPPARYLKWAAAGTPGIDFQAEAERLAWVRRWVTVPRVLDRGADDDGSWLVTAAIPGRSAVERRWVERSATAVAAIGRGLRAFHDAVPVGQCPFDWSVRSRLERVTTGPRPDSDRGGLGEAPSIDRLVVCLGDPCAPNTLLHDDGTVAGHVDLGSLGVADRWADLAVAAWSTEWNYGPGYEDLVYASYGVAPDPHRIAYYRALWDAT